MSSEESDDEPLAVLAAAKKAKADTAGCNVVVHGEGAYEVEIETVNGEKSKKNTAAKLKKPSVTIRLRKMPKSSAKAVVLRPSDVWLYLKDFNVTGPYSCLLCSEWFINRAKIIVHYILNHKKDFCGICRYFVPDRDAWHAHTKFHSPWPCSQCGETFLFETEARVHLSKAHSLVHCRLCHFRMPDNEQYDTHLSVKHNISNLPFKDDNMWEVQSDCNLKFMCLLCNKSGILSTTFSNHYMGFHHFTLKCFTSIVSGADTPFFIFGADVRPEFIETLKSQGKLGYIDLDNKPTPIAADTGVKVDENILKSIVLDIKAEALSDEERNELAHTRHWEEIKTYQGDEDFDVVLMELVVLHKTYFDYLNQSITDINSNVVSEVSDIDYEKKPDINLNKSCELCSFHFSTIQELVTHMHKMHLVRSVSAFSCRVCVTTFDTLNELDAHVTEELADFNDLWLCQFCDLEFDNRHLTRKHLTEHWDVMEYDNCFSPHLGFKCKYCPTLFWNELDREQHHVRVHFSKNVDQYYKCECNEIFSDKIWFTHHFIEKHYKNNYNPLYVYKCCICASVLPCVEDMRIHFATYHAEAKKVFCSLDPCRYRPFSHKKSFMLHIKNQHSIEGFRKERRCSCSACGREFTSARARNAHVVQIHGTGRFKCKICGEMLHSVDERKLHYLIQHPGQHPFTCKECGKSFQYKSSLYMHKYEHSPHKQSFTCKLCQKVFTKKESYREHMQIHEGPRHACSYCPMRFVQRSNMLRHERRHTGERPYTCPICRKNFSDKGACTAHVRTHTKDSFACLYCGQTFTQKSKLTYHIRRHTGENLETCQVCSKLFTSGCTLREHMKTHDEKKVVTVNCPLCDKTYRDQRNMIRHIRTSHANSALPCPLCQKTFKNPVGLRFHVLTHSKLHIFHCKLCPKSYAAKKSMVKHLRRRHSLRQGHVSTREFYRKLDPRECQLNLDEHIMTNIFGPPKIAGAFILSDYVTKLNMLNQRDKPNTSAANDNETDTQNSEENEECSDENDSEEKGNANDGASGDEIKTEDKNEPELEPTDFVSVKIEPMDLDEYSNN